ncbi:alpha/beta family hydrolase [Alteromonas ponticola]|uniref:Alpha/beta hydrolase n=1 Tax=Alteromonas ponticola TaxID=2720613 RepID=A0ABX1R0J8_9ALTE|nr:alpha/beta family hydrolase [Alteromonas ponticola]NMH58798.1 alpha/beta hydrolase [Alteromonas ponticola]
MSYSLELKSARHSASARMIIAHGAGAGKSSAFMQDLANGLSEMNIEVLLFDFPYMQLIEQTEKRRPPDRMPVLEAHYREIVEQSKLDRSTLPTFIGGKSMGGRVASMIAEQCAVQGIIVYGYPFHPPGKPEKTRTAHLANLQTPLLILQGERDPFGTADEIKHYSLSPAIHTSILTDGEHSFKPRKASGLTQQDNIQSAIEQTVQFIKEWSK